MIQVLAQYAYVGAELPRFAQARVLPYAGYRHRYLVQVLVRYQRSQPLKALLPLLPQRLRGLAAAVGVARVGACLQLRGKLL